MRPKASSNEINVGRRLTYVRVPKIKGSVSIEEACMQFLTAGYNKFIHIQAQHKT